MGLNIGGQVGKVNGKELSYSDFVQRYLLKNEPVVLTGLMDDWRACKDWVLPDGRPNLPFFSTHFGSSTVQVCICEDKSLLVLGYSISSPDPFFFKVNLGEKIGWKWYAFSNAIPLFLSKASVFFMFSFQNLCQNGSFVNNESEKKCWEKIVRISVSLTLVRKSVKLKKSRQKVSHWRLFFSVFSFNSNFEFGRRKGKDWRCSPPTLTLLPC